MPWALDDKRHSQKQFSAVRYDEKVLTTVITLGSPAQPAITSSHTGRSPGVALVLRCGQPSSVQPGSSGDLGWGSLPHFLPGHNPGDSVSSDRDQCQVASSAGVRLYVSLYQSLIVNRLIKIHFIVIAKKAHYINCQFCMDSYLHKNLRTQIQDRVFLVIKY